MSEKNVTDISSGNSPELARALEATPAASEDVRERVDVPGLPDGITPLTGVFTTHHAGRPHAIVLWQGAPWLVWQHPDGHWVTEAKVQVAALLRTPRGEGDGRADRMPATLAVSQSLSRVVAAMQAAWIEWRHGRGADAAMQWIENTLDGPGLIPDTEGEQVPDAQAFFDAAIAEIEEHRRGVEAEIAALAAPEPGGEGGTLESRAYDIAYWIAMEARVAESLGRSVAPIESEGARRIVALASARPTPADVRERVAEAWVTVEAAALAQANVLDSHYGGRPAEAAEIRNAVEQVAALLRAPRGEGEAGADIEAQGQEEPVAWLVERRGVEMFGWHPVYVYLGRRHAENIARVMRDGEWAVRVVPLYRAALRSPLGLDFVAHLREQREFSRRTFGPGPRTAGVIAHIRKELEELEADPYDLEEWIDVVLLACDGAWRHGHEPEAIAAALRAKLQKNKARQWPDWRTTPEDAPIEHVREGT